MDTGNALQVQVSTNPSIGPGTTMAASVSSINGHALSGAVSQTGNNTQAEQNLYYFFPPMAAGFTATGTVSLTYGSLPAGARVQFLARAGTIACSGGNTAPTVSITSPAANATFTAPASITLTASAQDSDGTVTQVQYFANASPIGTATSSPYGFAWTNVAAGAYSLTAVATDNSGATTTSAPVPITVGAAQAKLYFIHTDHLNTPRLISDDQQRTVWRWDNTDPFGGNPPDENPSGLGVFEFPLRFPGQYYDKETNLHYNYLRDCYDPATGRYCQPDPIGIIGQIRRNGETARHQHFMAGRYNLATDESVVTDLRALGFMPEKRVPETNLYSYVGGKPLSFTDPTGEIIREAAIIITATAIGITLYATYDCVSKCEKVCPIPQTGDPQNSRDRDAWILNCKVGCVKSFGGFLRKYTSPTPPIDPFIVK